MSGEHWEADFVCFAHSSGPPGNKMLSHGRGRGRDMHRENIPLEVGSIAFWRMCIHPSFEVTFAKQMLTLTFQQKHKVQTSVSILLSVTNSNCYPLSPIYLPPLASNKYSPLPSFLFYFHLFSPHARGLVTKPSLDSYILSFIRSFLLLFLSTGQPKGMAFL